VSVLELDGAAFRVRLDALPDAPKLARSFLGQLLDLWGISGDLADTALVLVSELATNAAKATGRVTGPACPLNGETIPTLVISAGAIWNGLHVEVWDNSPALPEIHELDHESEGGRGLILVEALASRWGCYAAAAQPSRTPGKATWFYLDLTTTPEPRPATPLQPLDGPVTLPRRIKRKRPDTAHLATEPLLVAREEEPSWSNDRDSVERLLTALLNLRTPEPQPA
jgi:anti-sigma regulatory factor (Ser/Thr protein kinase)